MKRDGRTPDHATLETIRLMAVERVREGEAVSAVIASYGFSRTTIYRWLAAAAKPGVGLRALQARGASGRPRSLTPRQEQQVFRWINGKDPRQYGLDFGLWTRSLVADLIERKFGIRVNIPRQSGFPSQVIAGGIFGSVLRKKVATTCPVLVEAGRKRNGSLEVQLDRQMFVHGGCQRQSVTQSGSSPDRRLVPGKTVVILPRP